MDFGIFINFIMEKFGAISKVGAIQDSAQGGCLKIDYFSNSEKYLFFYFSFLLFVIHSQALEV